MVLPIQTVEEPVMAFAMGFVTLTLNAGDVVEQPLPSVTVYEIFVVPVATAVTTPVVLTVAAAGFDDNHV